MKITNYKKEIKNRMIIGAVFIILSVILFLILKYFQNNVFQIEGFAKGFPEGIITSIGFLGLVVIIMNYRLLKNEEELKKSYIKENDEREIQIGFRSYEITYRISIVLFLIGAVIASFISLEALYLLIALIALSTITLVTSYYIYGKKY